MTNNNENRRECDVFGRACFWNAMKQFSIVQHENCSLCWFECDIIEFEKKIVKVEKIVDGAFGGKYFKIERGNFSLSQKIREE